MKKNLLLLMSALVGMTCAQAQYFTLRLAGGYAWPGFQKSENLVGPKVIFSPDKDGLVDMANINDSIPFNQTLHGSYGKGGNFSFGFGYMINRYVGVELGVSYLQSATFSCNQVRQLTVQSGFGNPPSFSTVGDYYMNARIATHAFGLSLMPSVIVQGAKEGWKVYPYARLGISMPVFGELTHDIKIDVQDNVFDPNDPSMVNLASLIHGSPYFLGHHTNVTLKTEGTVSIGMNGAVGVTYQPLPYLAVSAEVNGQYLVTRAKNARLTKWESDGEDRLADRGVYRTEFNFVDELSNTSNNQDYNKNYDKTKPKDDLRPTAPFTNLGFNVSVTFMLSKAIVKGDKAAKK